MIEEITQQPIGIFTTVQPILFGWVLAISFFVTISIVALLMKGRTTLQVLMLSFGVFGVVSIGATVVSTWVVGIDVISMDFFFVGSAELPK